jgi:hypothetical protein
MTGKLEFAAAELPKFYHHHQQQQQQHCDLTEHQL